MGFKVYAILDCYKGLDSMQEVSVFAKRAEERPIENYEEEEEDEDLNKPSYIEELVQGITGKEKKDEEADLLEEEEKTEPTKKSKKGNKKHKKE